MRLLNFLFAFGTIGTIWTTEDEGCRDGIDNVFSVDSFDEGAHLGELPVRINNVTIHVYDIFYKPSCYNGKVNIRMPGYFRISGGEIHVPKEYDLFDHAIVRASVSMNDRAICENGKGAMFFIPNKLCHFHFTTFVPDEISLILQQKGIHTLKELEQKLHFNSTLELPPSPSFMGVYLLDILKGHYKIKIDLAIKGKLIARISIPKGYAPMQWGLK